MPGIYREICLLSYDKFMAEHDYMICLGTTNNQRRLIYTFGTRVLAGQKQFGDLVEYKARALILTLDNNSGLCVWADSFEKEDSDISKIPIGVFYPPPRSKGIVQILPSIYDPDEYLMLVEGGDICLSRMERGTGVMVWMQKSELI